MVKENLAFCREKLKCAARASGAALSDITLVCVTKGVLLPRIYEVVDQGITHVGESRVREAWEKFDSLNDYAKSKRLRLTWHMIGHLQTNKVKDAVRMFDLIHSVDSARLAQSIDQEAWKTGKIQDVLLEVKTSPEATKFGFSCEEALKAAEEMASLKNIKIKGLMTIAPQVNDPEEARPFFHQLRNLSDKIFVHRPSSIVHRPILSMGMTDDFQVAVEEGSTMVRIGRGIFGEKQFQG